MFRKEKRPRIISCYNAHYVLTSWERRNIDMEICQLAAHHVPPANIGDPERSAGLSTTQIKVTYCRIGCQAHLL